MTNSDVVEDSDTMIDSGVPFWAVEPETQRVRLSLPPEAFPHGGNTPGPVLDLNRDWEAAAGDAEQRAVTFFDRGIALQAQDRYAEALEAWEKALELAPEDPFYQASVKRLRAQIRSRER